jgi:glycosyltransferase involved in cell wall biosynthesis
MNPMISVVMPVYNGERYLREAIESILNQTYKNFEFIILNDGSNDKTEEIILSYDDPRIVYIKNSKNLRIVKTLNKGISLAKGVYIARMDADDISLPTRFEKQIQHLEKHHEVDICGTAIKHIGCKNEVQYFPRNHNEIKVNLLFNSAFAHPTIMGKSIYFKNHTYNDGYVMAEDYYLWASTCEKHHFSNLEDVLLYYRNHGTQTNKVLQQKQAKKVRNYMIKISKIQLSSSSIDILHRIVTYHYVKKEDAEKVINNILQENKFFDQTYLMKELAKRYRWMMDANTSKGIKIFWEYITSWASNIETLPMSFYIKFFIKCIIRK